MITIPNPVKYDKDLHFNEMITKFIDPNVTANIRFITNAIATLEKDNAEIYMVRRYLKVAVCRKGLRPAIMDRPIQHEHYFAMKKNGRLLVSGKNLRKPESILTVLKHMLHKSPKKVKILNLHYKELPTAEKFKEVGYELLKQYTPFE